MPLEIDPRVATPWALDQPKIPPPTPRQYKPTYSRLSSTGSIPNFGYPPRPAVSQPRQGYNRRRTTYTFPVPDPLHSPPTVASSDLTASVSVGDISQPTPRSQRKPLQLRHKALTRIPTPAFNQRNPKLLNVEKCNTVLDSSGEAEAGGISDSGEPVLRNLSNSSRSTLRVPDNSASIGKGQKGHKRSPAIRNPASAFELEENVLPKSLRLLDPIQSSPAEPVGLPKSRTASVLATLASPFSRSTPSLGVTRNASAVSLLAKSDIRLVSLPLPTFSGEAGQISHHVPSSYWAGRFTALHDRYRSEVLEPKFLETQMHMEWKVGSEDEIESAPYTREEQKLGKRVFNYLEALCVTIEAKASLWRFQQDYARLANCEALLPFGGSMGYRNNFMAKARRMLPGGGKTSLGVTNRGVNRLKSNLNLSYTRD